LLEFYNNARFRTENRIVAISTHAQRNIYKFEENRRLMPNFCIVVENLGSVNPT